MVGGVARVPLDVPPYMMTAADGAVVGPNVVGLRRALRDHGLAGRVEGMTAWVDAAFLNEAGIPAICFGPGSIGQAHSACEWVEVQQVRDATVVLETFTRRFLGIG